MRFGKAWFFAAALAAFACGGDETADPGPGPGEDPGEDPGEEPEPTTSRAGFVFDTITVPTSEAQAKQVALDIDGDGEVDNALGNVISTLASFSDSVDVQGQVDDSLADGSVILLADLGYSSLNSGNGLMTLFQGDNPGTAPCDGEQCGKHLSGGTSFDISVASPQDNTVSGALSAGVFTGSDGVVTIPLPLGTSINNIEVIGAATRADVTKTTLSGGILGGGVSEDEIDTKILPAVAELMGAYTAQECTLPAPTCCPNGTDGKTIMDLFDENNDCSITTEELKNNFLVATLLKADLDLLDENGDYNPGVDGVLDSVSIGIGYSGIDATFTP
ncbi:MAG: hypothetical protein KJO07_20880 [Deltaproteobacteria bacterium]|nr:hypothetical protein [Deltaproteobacteria bacterium]